MRLFNTDIPDDGSKLRESGKQRMVKLTHSTPLAIALASLVAISGCSTSGKTVKYTEGEVRVIPAPLMPRLLRAPASGITVEVTAQQLHGYASVKKTLEQDNSVVVTVDGHDTLLPYGEITGIRQTDRWVQKDNSLTGTASSGEVVANAIIFAPLIPIAAVTWPFMRMAGLDTTKNFADEAKAMAVYGGLSRQEVIDHLGTPQARHHCTKQTGNVSLAFDVWSYPKERVLRGGRALFFDTHTDSVSNTSVNFPTWADCIPLDSTR